MKIIIADHNDIIKRGLNSLIRDFWPDIDIILVENFEKLKKILLHETYHALFVDPEFVSTPYDEMMFAIRMRAPDSSIIIYTNLSAKLYAIKSLKFGAKAFIEKSATENELVVALTAVLSGGRYVKESIKEQLFNLTILANGKPDKELSEKETIVASLLAQGRTINYISSTLSLKPGTVSTFKSRIFKKFQVKSVIELSEKIKSF